MQKKINPRLYKPRIYGKIFFMLTKKILQQNYTLNRKFYQLKLPFDIDCIIPENDSVRLLSQFVEEMDLTELYSTYSKIRENLILQELCLKYKCSLAQLILRWDIDQGLVPIPKSSSSLRLAQNIQLDFSIEKNDIDLISSLNENFQYLPESIYCPGY